MLAVLLHCEDFYCEGQEAEKEKADREEVDGKLASERASELLKRFFLLFSEKRRGDGAC